MKHKKSKTKELPERGLNVWNKYDFAMCGLGEKNRFIAKLKHIKRCIKYSKQRIVRGYSDSDVWDMYGLFGEKLQTEEEMKRNDQGEVYCTMHFMDELPEYKEISEKYRNEEKKLEEYRNSCKDKALDMLKEYFLCLWD